MTGDGFDHTDPYFDYLDRGYRPNPVAKSARSDTLLGGVVGGLLACALECEAVSPGWQPARLTVDILRPARMEVVQVHAKVIHHGRQARVAEAILNQGETTVARASALFIRGGQQTEQQVWASSADMPPAPTAPVRPERRSPCFSRTFGWNSLTRAGADPLHAHHESATFRSARRARRSIPQQSRDSGNRRRDSVRRIWPDRIVDGQCATSQCISVSILVT